MKKFKLINEVWPNQCRKRCKIMCKITCKITQTFRWAILHVYVSYLNKYYGMATINIADSSQIWNTCVTIYICFTVYCCRPTVAGIHGGPDGAYSIALSGGYDDNLDLGDGFTYTGEGGRDLKGTRTNPKVLKSYFLTMFFVFNFIQSNECQSTLMKSH